jgi:cyclic pyranopterin phosphate synthase
MAKKEFSHVSTAGKPQMVDVSKKAETIRTARAQARINPGKEIMQKILDQNFSTAKGSVFHTAIIAGIMGAKKTAELIPFCHPLQINNCDIDIDIQRNKVLIICSVTCAGKTGVEMEALTGASIAALTFYDMCKALSHAIVIEEIKLLEKTGGKSDFKTEQKK